MTLIGLAQVTGSWVGFVFWLLVLFVAFDYEYGVTVFSINCNGSSDNIFLLLAMVTRSSAGPWLKSSYNYSTRFSLLLSRYLFGIA